MTGQRPAFPCPRCGAEVAPDQSWCTECGLAARTRLAPVPRWKAPLIAAGAIGLAAIGTLIVAFLVVTADNAPLPTTATAAPAPVVATTTLPTVPTVATTPTTPTVPAIPTTATTP